MSFNHKDLMNNWISGDKYEEYASKVFTTKAELDEFITHLAASAVKLTLDSVAAGNSPSGAEANILLMYAHTYMKREAVLLRKYLCHFGPFVEIDKPFTLQRKGKQPLIIPLALKWSQQRYDKFFKNKDGSAPDSAQIARMMKAVTFNTWKKATKDEEKKAGKTEEQLREDKVKSLQKRAAKLQEEMAEIGVSNSDLNLTVREVVKDSNLPETPNAKSLIELIKRMTERTDLSTDDRELCQSLLDFAMKYYELKNKKAA